MGVAHPRIIEVPLGNGEKVRVKKWTMAQRDELRPKVIAVLDTVGDKSGGLTAALGTDLVQLFILVEDQVVEIVRDSIPLEELSAEGWAAMDWGDIPNLAQAIWDLNVTGSGGLMGKVGAALGTMIANALIAAGTDKAGITLAAAEERSASNSTKTSSPLPTPPTPGGSPSSLGEATATPST